MNQGIFFLNTQAAGPYCKPLPASQLLHILLPCLTRPAHVLMLSVLCEFTELNFSSVGSQLAPQDIACIDSSIVLPHVRNSFLFV